MITKEEIRQLNAVTLYLKPTYSVVLPMRSSEPRTLTAAQLENLKNLEKNSSDGSLSRKAQQRLVNSVNWLLAAAKKKRVFSKEQNRSFLFRVNFITLTLPGQFQEISDHKFKSVLLHNFINTCRYKYNLKNFVWKVEAQANGKIHAHFTTDSFIPIHGLRRTWNEILRKNGLLDMYIAKHSQMSLEDYIEAYNNEGKVDVKTLTKRYKEGTASGWSNPNSTDVKAVHKVDDLGAYMSKYFSKNDDERRKIEGRLWACSYHISQANKTAIDIPFDMAQTDLAEFFKPNINYKQLFINEDDPLKMKKIGELFFYKLGEIGKSINGKIADIYKSVLFNIRHCIDIDFFKEEIQEITNKYSYVPPEHKPKVSQTYCPF